MIVSRRLCGVISSVVSGVLLCFCIDAHAATRYGGSLILSTISDPKSFNDILAKETSTTDVTELIFEGLTTINVHTLEVEPKLAASWEVSPDGRVWMFHLRDDVLWNDGVAFTADDVVFTFNELIYNPTIPSSSRDIFTIDGKTFLVEKIDDHTVRFTLPMKFAPFLRSMAQAILPRHKLQAAVTNGTFNFTWGIDTDPREIVGTGPFRLVRYIPGERFMFERNPRYWKRSKEGDQLPYLDRVVYLIVQSEDTALLKFIDGEIDYYSMRGSDYPLLKPLEAKKKFIVYNSGPDFGTNFLVFNQNRGVNPKTNEPFVPPVKLAWFTNGVFRQAVAHAIDKAKIISILMNGLGYEQHAAISPSAGFFYNPNVVKYPYDLDAARALLAKEGFRDRNGDGIIEDAAGNPVEFSLSTNAGAVERIQIAGIIRHDLAQLGMKVNFQAVEFNALISKVTGTYDWDAIILGLTGGGADPHFGKNVWMSDGQLHVWYPQQKTPATEWERRIDEIFNAGVQELDENMRKVLYDEFQLIASQQLPFIYTVLSSRLYAVRDIFGNLDPTPLGGAFHNIDEIYIQEPRP